MKLSFAFLGFTFLLISACSSTSDISPQSPSEKKAEVYYTQGTTELVQKNYGQALIYLTKAKELNPKDSKIRNNLGMAYYFRDQMALAEEELKEAISLDRKNTDARLNLGSLYMGKNRLKEARTHFEQVALDLTFPNQFRNYYNLAILSLKEGDRKQAFEMLAKSVKEKDDYCAAHFKLGELYSEEYRFQLALASFREASKGTCISEPAPFYQQALALLNLNRIDDAKKVFKDIAEKFPTTRYSALANVQLRKISERNSSETATRSYQTEIIKESQAIESPKF